MDTLVALLGIFGWGTFASTVFPAVVLGLIWKKATKQGAIASIAVGLSLNFILEISQKYGITILPEGVIIGAFSLACSIIIFVTVSHLTYKANAVVDKKVLDAMAG